MDFVIELIGYLGSILVLISMLMSSVIKLRLINTIGSMIFTVYAFIIQTYPTAILNVILVGVNIYNLVKLLKSSKQYDIVDVDINDSFVRYFVEHYKNDIEKYFPGFKFDTSLYDFARIVCCDTNPAGILIGNKEGAEIEIDLDYTTPMYRDCSVGKFLYEELRKIGVTRLIDRDAVKEHSEYLEKMGFVKTEEGYIKDI